MPPGKVTMLGDSLTDLGDWARLLPGVDVGNRGLGSETSAGLLGRLRGGERVGPTVFLLIGVNDEGVGLSEEQTRANIRAIVQHLRGRRIFLQSTLPRTTGGDAERLHRIADFERSLCAEGACRFVDLRPALAPGGLLEPRYAIDATHLNWTGYLRWGAVVRAALADVSPASPPPAPSGPPAAARPRG